MTNCIFCRITNNEIPAPRVYEDENAIVIRDLNPQAPVHLLAIPRKHFAALHEVPAQDAGLFEGLLSAVMRAVKQEKLDEAGYRLVVNSGESAGQTVGHIHVHILSGRQLHWPPG